MADPGPRAEVLTFSHAWDRPGTADHADVTPTSWSQACASLGGISTYWLATLREGPAPHMVPILAVMVDEAMHFCASDQSRKARNLAADPHCVLGGSSEVLDIMVEGRADPVQEEPRLAEVADAYAAKYGWQPGVRDGGLWASGAPTAGPAPYRAYRLAPKRVFGFPTADEVIPTRWEFRGRA